MQGPEIKSLDLTVEITPSYRNAAFHIYDPLFLPDEKLQPRPNLATGYTVEDNGSRIRLQLRPGVKFHDGTPFTSNDVKFTLDRVADPQLKPRPSSHLKYVSAFKEVKIIDPLTVDILLGQFDATIPGRLTMIPMVSKDWVTAKGPEALVGEGMGTGPFRLKEWVKGEQIVLEANRDYWGAPPKVQTVIWKSIVEGTTRAATVQTGAADVVVSVPDVLAKQINSDGKAEVQYVHSLRNLWVVLNAYKKPYDDVRVRKALNHAVNVDLYIKTILGGNAHRTASIIGPGVFGFNPSLKPYEYNPDKAKALLAEAGYPNGFESTLMFRTDSEVAGESEVAQAIAADLATVGVKVKLDPAELNTLITKYSRVLNMDADMWINSNSNSSGDADYGLTVAVWSKGNGPDRTGYYWPTATDVDEAIVKARSIIDVKERERVYHFIYQRLYDEATNIFMFDTFNSYAFSKRVQGVRPLADETLLLHTASLSG